MPRIREDEFRPLLDHDRLRRGVGLLSAAQSMVRSALNPLERDKDYGRVERGRSMYRWQYES